MSYKRDCEHGSQIGKCYICDLVEAENRIAELEKEIEAHERNDAANYKIMDDSSKQILELQNYINIALDNSKEQLITRIAELEEAVHSLQSYNCRVITFVTRAVEKLRGIPEFKPTGDVLNRALRMAPKTALQAHNLEQQAKGVREFGEWYESTNSDSVFDDVTVGDLAELRANSIIADVKQLREGVSHE